MTRESYISNFLLFLIVALCAYLVFNFFGLSPAVFMIIIGFALFYFSFLKTDLALAVIIFSMLFSPEFKIGSAGSREVVARLEDIFLLVVFLGWLAKMAVNKEIGLLRSTSLNKPILAYGAFALAATLFGALRGYTNIKVGIFYLLKYFEYYLLFFMVSNNLKDRHQIKKFIFLIFIAAFLVSIYACIQHLMGASRVAAPFEGASVEANTLGGYLLFIIMVGAGIFLNSNDAREKFFLSIFFLFALPAFLFTLSRGSWLGFIAAFIYLFILARKNRPLLFVVILLAVLFSPFILPRAVKERVSDTFREGKTYRLAGRNIILDESASARVEVWKYGLRKWLKEPLFGYGVAGAAPVVDNQYVRVIIETGTVGFIFFMAIIAAIIKNFLNILRRLSGDDFAYGLVMGFLAGLAGILIHSFSAESFMIIRIMEPFWFIAALIAVLPDIPDVRPLAQAV